MFDINDVMKMLNDCIEDFKELDLTDTQLIAIKQILLSRHIDAVNRITDKCIKEIKQ